MSSDEDDRPNSINHAIARPRGPPPSRLPNSPPPNYLANQSTNQSTNNLSSNLPSSPVSRGARPPPPNRKPTAPVVIANNTTNNINDYKEENDLSYESTSRSSEISEMNPMTSFDQLDRQVAINVDKQTNRKVDREYEFYGPLDYMREFDEEESYSEFESEARQMLDKKYNYPNPIGLSRTTRRYIETPKEFLSRILTPDEQIVAQFDVVFPTIEPSLKQKIFFNLITLGIYSLYRYFLFPCFRYFYSLCFNHPSIYQSRGKLVITSTGRVIYWSIDLSQYASCLDSSLINYQSNHRIHVSNCKDICETAIVYSDSWLGRLTSCVCCRAYRAGIDITFNGFNHNRNFDDWLPITKYLYTLPNNLYQRFISNYLSIPSNNLIGGQVDRTPVVIRIVTGPTDNLFEGVGREPIEDLLNFHLLLNELIVRFQPMQTFLPISASENKDIQAQQSTTRFYGVKDENEDIEDYQPITGNGVDILISKKWLSLCSDEQLIGAVGQTYITTYLDIFLSIVTIGLYYLLVISKYKRFRHVTVLTTRRVANIYLEDPSDRGRVPQSFSNFKIYIHSLFPQVVQSGCIVGLTKGDKSIYSYLQTIYGSIFLSIPFVHLSFLLKLQLTISRADSLELDRYLDSKVDSKVDSKINGYIDKYIPVDEVPYLPTFNDEKIICYFKSEKDFKPIYPFSYLPTFPSVFSSNYISTSISNGFCGFNSYISTYLSIYPSSLTAKSFLNLSVRYISCGYLSISFQANLLITNHSIIYLSLSFRDLNMYQTVGTIDRLNKPFFMLWYPIRSFNEFTVYVSSQGYELSNALCTHPSGSTCGCCCIRQPKQIKSEYHVYLSNSQSIPLSICGSFATIPDSNIDSKEDSKTVKLTNWLRNKQLRELQYIFSCIQSLVNRDR